MSALIVIVNSGSVCTCGVCMYACAMGIDMSDGVVISEWLHHCVVHLKLPALSSKL